jgi:hypothetical protein
VGRSSYAVCGVCFIHKTPAVVRGRDGRRDEGAGGASAAVVVRAARGWPAWRRAWGAAARAARRISRSRLTRRRIGGLILHGRSQCVDKSAHAAAVIRAARGWGGAREEVRDEKSTVLPPVRRSLLHGARARIGQDSPGAAFAPVRCGAGDQRVPRLGGDGQGKVEGLQADVLEEGLARAVLHDHLLDVARPHQPAPRADSTSGAGAC